MKTVLITGVAGLLGSRLADWIIANKPEYKVVGIDDLSGGYRENINPQVDFWEVNLIDAKHRIDLCFEENKFDYVFHLTYCIPIVVFSQYLLTITARYRFV